ncbi:hypothetical protein MTO96_029403 [Rhipicephalus appendiculatus]
MMEYAVEGDTLTPEEFEAGEWAPVLRAQDRFKKSQCGHNAKSTPCETQAGSDGRKTHGAEQVKRGKAPAWKKRGPFLKMPATDFKVVYRPQNWGLSMVTARELGCALREAARIKSATAAEEDLVRVNGTNNTLTVSTPCMNRSGAYATVKTLKLSDCDLPVSAYVAPLENSVRGVIYNAYDGCPVEEVRAGFLKKNDGMQILDARPLGKSKAIQITFGGKRSRNCKFRLARKPPTGRQQSIERESQAGKDERSSRATERSSRGKGGRSKSRDRSSSFPPLPGGGSGKEGGRVSSPDRKARDATKKVSLSNAGSQNETARERELETLVQQQSAAMEVENRGPV